MLFHYNGHGVPRPTVNGEIWVFNKSYTQYIPMSIYDLQAWLGTPCIFVFDCSAAGLIVNSFKAFAEQKPQVGTATLLALYTLFVHQHMHRILTREVDLSRCSILQSSTLRSGACQVVMNQAKQLLHTCNICRNMSQHVFTVTCSPCMCCDSCQSRMQILVLYILHICQKGTPQLCIVCKMTVMHRLPSNNTMFGSHSFCIRH